MRLFTFSLLSLSLFSPSSYASQSPLLNPLPSSTTLVDVLSSDSDYTSLLSLLQRARLIPTLNRLNGSTLFAPTNDAIKRHAISNPLWQLVLQDTRNSSLADNVQEKLRQQLFYHLLNFTLPDLPTKQSPRTLETLHYPRKPPDHPSRDPPPSPPWMPIPGGTLGGKPQRLRVAARDSHAYIGVDAFGSGGAEVTKERREAGNGIIFGIGDVLEPPSDLAQVVLKQTSLSYLRKIMSPVISNMLNSSSELTLFLPVDPAWDNLDPYERLYLESEFAASDLTRILNMHAVVEKSVRWSDTLNVSTTLTTLEGTKLEIAVSKGKTNVSTSELLQPDIYASNGVLHLVSSLLLPPGTLQLTPEKYLLALNCTTFVSLLHSVGLEPLINDTETKMTILAPRDDVLSNYAGADLPEKGSPALRRLLQYHFVPGRWTPKKVENGMLIETMLEEEGLNGGRQVVDVEVTPNDKKKDATKSIHFGGAGIIGDSIEVNNTVIYFVSRLLSPPTEPLETALPHLDLSSFLAAVFSTSQADTLRKTPCTTLLIPHNSAFKRLGLLVSTHLLSSSAKQDLESVVLHHAIDSVEYARSLQNGSQHTFSTLEGSDLKLDRYKNGSLSVGASGGWSNMRSELYPRDLLTQTGVIHELSDVLIPRSVQLTVGKLVKAAKGSTMATLVVKAGFEWVLNGTAPPEGTPWADRGMSGAGWTLLCPTDDAFKKYNLDALYADTTILQAIIAQHLVPMPSSGHGSFAFDDGDVLNNNRPLLLVDSATYSTLQSESSFYGDIVFRQREEEKDFVVGIKGARGTDGTADWARVISWGRSTIGGGTGGVIQIDRLLMPYHPSWWIEYGVPSTVGVSDTQQVDDSHVSASESVKAFIAGGVGGACAVLVGHPFDLTKTRLQTAPAGTYTGSIDVVKKILVRDGVTGLYRGMVPPLLGVTPIFAVSFWAYDASKRLIYALTPGRKSDSLSIPELATAGFLSAIPTTLVTAPVERAKVLLQVQGQGQAEQKYKGVTDVLRHLYKEGGIRSIYRGSVATLARDGPGSAAYFAAYEVTKKTLTPADASSADLNLGAIIVAGGMAGVAMWALAIPPDVIKSRIQSAPSGTYSGFWDCTRKTIASDGVAALWKGFGPAMARAFPANAATFLGVEASRKILDQIF
ncbi:hypothetical protein AMATHDRAFT_72571 [Amanita thiersii Skay4041]|uniref:FAS1 domain-containing protein n=1 Tax=Amanita thiersii Skay4041 TaxID=703135 RepID=A0A2A9P128_9AGAR|nr:hypothetical protein AMATHDRAFT_72571 [Amanita thiersii Skay4041]